MASPYTQDLSLEIAYKLYRKSVYSISTVSNEWSILIDYKFWTTKFIRDFSSTLPIEANYQIEYLQMESLSVEKLYRYVISKNYTSLLVYMLGKWKRVYALLPDAAIYSNIEVIKLLISKGASIHNQDDKALRSAAAGGRLDVVKLLLDNGASIHALKDEALTLAANNNHIEVVKILLDNGADIKALNYVTSPSKYLRVFLKRYKENKNNKA